MQIPTESGSELNANQQSALHATMQGVYSAALYRYATDHTTPLPGFGSDLLEHAFAPKK